VMLSKKKLSHQLEMFNTFDDLLNQNHPLYKLANKVNWQKLDDELSVYYCPDNGRPAKPIRTMVGLLILKHLRNLSDESVVAHWSENNYFQYFTGEFKFNSTEPCTPEELVVFRNRIGEVGMELILKESIVINTDETPFDQDNFTVSIDTTVQEKNITYPTDDKQYKKVIKKCWTIAQRCSIKLRRSHSREVKKLSQIQRFKNNKKYRKQGRKANARIRTIAGILVRELGRKLPLASLGEYLQELKLFMRIISQKREDSDKIYSLHEPDTKCYTKGKEHKKFEFGSKISLVTDQQTGIIVGAYNFTQTIHDSKTIPDAIEQCERLTGLIPKEAYVDRGYKGIAEYKTCKIQIPKPQKKITQKKRNKHKRRAAIEPIIGHLKQDYRLCRNYYKGIKGDIINIMLAAIAFNFKRVINLWRSEASIGWQIIMRFFLWCWDRYALFQRRLF
jgi:transposase, IS5 family